MVEDTGATQPLHHTYKKVFERSETRRQRREPDQSHYRLTYVHVEALPLHSVRRNRAPAFGVVKPPDAGRPPQDETRNCFSETSGTFPNHIAGSCQRCVPPNGLWAHRIEVTFRIRSR